MRTILPALFVALLACEGGDGESSNPSSSLTASGLTNPGTAPYSGTPTTTTPSECPLFDGTACEAFLDGCWDPDLAGTCQDDGLELGWSDGHRIVRTGANAGLYGPGDAEPCITLDFDLGTMTSTLTNVATGETLLNTDLQDGNIRITCTDGTELLFTVAELEADNVCKGISCP